MPDGCGWDRKSRSCSRPPRRAIRARCEVARSYSVEVGQRARRDRDISTAVAARMIVPMDSTTSVVGTSLKLSTS
jgi:hypothetical protein